MAEGEIITVKELIIRLLDCDMDNEIIIRDKQEKQLHGVSLNVKNEAGIGCLFG